ncbi:MAG: ABC-type transport auxiliary lipoprotein family protein [Rhizobacter sp.]
MKPLLVSIALFVGLAGCSSTPPTRYHSLLSTSDAKPQDASLPALPIDLGPVKVPASVDQMQWVVRLPDESLRILEGEQWVSPLRDELRAALFERLVQRYAAVDARTVPGAQAVRVKVDVQRFESVAGKEVWLDSVWSAQIDANKPVPLLCRSSVREAAVGDLAALAAAHRRAVTRLADEIGGQVLALVNGAGVRCP